jgi:hypothetical protein
LIGLAEGDIKRGHFCAILAKNVEHICEVHPGERPLAEHFLGMLVDVDNHNSRINGSDAPRAIAEAGVQRIVFQALNEIENGSRALAKKSEIVERQRQQGDEHTDDKRGAMAPPRLEKFVEAEEAPPLPETI